MIPLADGRMSNGQKLQFLGLMIIAVICSRGTQHMVCGFAASDIFPISYFYGTMSPICTESVVKHQLTSVA